MAKHKSGRALFEILAKERREEAARRSPQATPEPIVRRYGAGRETEAGSRRPTERPVQRTAPKRGGERRISLTYYHLAIAMVLVACAGMILFVLGTRFGRPRLPQTEARPTMEEVLKAPSAPGLVMPRPGATEEGAEEEAETGAPEEQQDTSAAVGAGTAPPPAEQAGRYRLRIARLSVSQSEYTDRLRALLSRNGVETDLEARAGSFILYSRVRFAAPDQDPAGRFAKEDVEKAKAFAKKVNGLLKEFEQKTGWPAATNPYFVVTTEE